MKMFPLNYYLSFFRFNVDWILIKDYIFLPIIFLNLISVLGLLLNQNNLNKNFIAIFDKKKQSDFLY